MKTTRNKPRSNPARRPSFPKPPNLVGILKLRNGEVYTITHLNRPGNTGVFYSIDTHEIQITSDSDAGALGSILLDTVGLRRKGGDE